MRVTWHCSKCFCCRASGRDHTSLPAEGGFARSLPLTPGSMPDSRRPREARLRGLGTFLSARACASSTVFSASSALCALCWAVRALWGAACAPDVDGSAVRAKAPTPACCCRAAAGVYCPLRCARCWRAHCRRSPGCCSVHAPGAPCLQHGPPVPGCPPALLLSV